MFSLARCYQTPLVCAIFLGIQVIFYFIHLRIVCLTTLKVPYVMYSENVVLASEQQTGRDVEEGRCGVFYFNIISLAWKD
jgi:hypothetical protein